VSIRLRSDGRTLCIFHTIPICHELVQLSRTGGGRIRWPIPTIVCMIAPISRPSITISRGFGPQNIQGRRSSDLDGGSPRADRTTVSVGQTVVEVGRFAATMRHHDERPRTQPSCSHRPHDDHHRTLYCPSSSTWARATACADVPPEVVPAVVPVGECAVIFRRAGQRVGTCHRTRERVVRCRRPGSDWGGVADPGSECGCVIDRGSVWGSGADLCRPGGKLLCVPTPPPYAPSRAVTTSPR